MTYSISNLVQDLKLTILTDIYVDLPVSRGCCCDMLSWAMSRLDSASAWFTILNSMNVIAVASLSECPCIILTEGVELSDNILVKAKEESICVCTTQETTFDSAACLAEALRHAKG